MIRTMFPQSGQFRDHVPHIAHSPDIYSPDQGGQVRIRRDCPRKLGKAEAMPLVPVDIGQDVGVEIVVEDGTDKVAEQGAGTADTSQVGDAIVAPEAAVFIKVAKRKDDLPYFCWKTWADYRCRAGPASLQTAERLHQSV